MDYCGRVNTKLRVKRKGGTKNNSCISSNHEQTRNNKSASLTGSIYSKLHLKVSAFGILLKTIAMI